MRVVSWNINFRGPEAAKRQGGLLCELAPDLMLLQEVNPGSSADLAEAAGADWMVKAIDLRPPVPDDSPVRWRGVAIAGHGPQPCRSWLLDEIGQSERILLIETQTKGTPFIAVSYHAPPGVTWKIVKPRQAVAFASWLSTQNGPLLFGADANTPLIDALDFANTRTHWYTGRPRLHGEPGDDHLFGPCKMHDLKDALRCWLDLNPDEMERLRASKPSGPLAITYRTKKGKHSPGAGRRFERRFDSIWVSRHWVVRHIEHPYEKGIAAGSDHAPVVVDLDLTGRPGKEEEMSLIKPCQHPQLRDQLAGMAEFAALFETPGFWFGKIISSPVRRTEEALEFTGPYSVHSPEADRFVEQAYRLGWVRQNFDWMSWEGSAEARRLRDPSTTLASASPEQLAKLLTLLIRGDHFSETTLVEAFNSGVLTAIVKRMAALLNDGSIDDHRNAGTITNNRC
jgi:endonuclease/exonuclease/phosphatase family metal-dependent hydrolase